MPKDRRASSFSYRTRTLPYACCSKNSDLERGRPLSPVGNETEWEEARCPICMEHPHNAVLLLCSSRENGCRPYMCDTSYRHSNCLDQFCKSSAAGANQEGNYVPRAVFHGRSRQQALSGPTRSHGKQQTELVCPLCRGHVKGWIVVQAARQFMDSKTRSCSLETCNFSGSYPELRKHARLEHPSERPSLADPSRQSEWTRLEMQRDLEDALDAYYAPSGDDLTEDDFLADVPLDGGLFDLLDGFSEADEGSSEDSNMLLDFEFELSFSFLNEFPLMPWAWDGFPSVPEGRRTSRSQVRARSLNRSRSSASRSDYDEGRPTTIRSTDLPSRSTPSSYRRTEME